MRFKYRKYIYIGSFSVMLLGMTVFSTNKLPSTGRTESKGVSSTPAAISTETLPSGEKTAVSSGLLMKNAYPEVNRLIETYFDAVIKVDEKVIKECVDNVEYAGIDKLPKRVKEIERIDNVVCYTLDGPEADSYIVYAYNEVKFKNISTKSTALDGYYVKKDENGKLKIILSPLADEIQKIIDEDAKREDVVALISDVNTKLTKEIKSDKQLAALLKRMREAEHKGE